MSEIDTKEKDEVHLIDNPYLQRTRPNTSSFNSTQKTIQMSKTYENRFGLLSVYPINTRG